MNLKIYNMEINNEQLWKELGKAISNFGSQGIKSFEYVLKLMKDMQDHLKTLEQKAHEGS